MNLKDFIRQTKGLTLVELMVVLVLSMVLMAAVYMTYQIQHKTITVQQEVSAIQQDIRAVLDIMARDIRLAGCDPSMHSTAGILSDQTGPASISFTMDLNDDGDTDDSNPDEQVSYTLSGSDLLRNGTVLAENVTTLGFVYYDEDDVIVTPTGSGGSHLTTTESATVREVDIQITVQSSRKDPDLNQYISRSMIKRVRMRNQGI